MTTDLVTLQNATARSGSLIPSTGSKELGKEEFLKLLMTQLAQQDPLNPTDSTEFVAQLSQFTQVEGIYNLSSKLDELVSLTSANNSSVAVSLLGKEVRVGGNTLGGSSDVFYEFPQDAGKAVLTVRNKAGEIVKVKDDIEKSAGLHRVSIDELPKGEYTFIVEAMDQRGEEMKAGLSHVEKVNGVSFAGQVPILLMESGTKMNATDVIEIREPLTAGGANHG